MPLLEERMTLSKIIGILKQEQSRSITDSAREQSILDKTKPFKHASSLETVYRTLIEESKKIQGKG